MSSSDIKTTPRFMTAIQRELEAATRMCGIDPQPIKDAETVFFDRGVVRNVFDYLNDNPIDPEWLPLVPDGVFVGTELPIICSFPGNYLGKFRRKGTRFVPDLRQFSSDVECFYFTKDGRVSSPDGTTYGHSLCYGRCAGLRESSRYNANFLKNRTFSLTGTDKKLPSGTYDGKTVYRQQVDELNAIATSRTPLAPIVAFGNGDGHAMVSSDKSLYEKVPYMTPSAVDRLLADIGEMVPYPNGTDAFILAFLMTAFAMGENLIDGYAECEKVTVKPPKTEAKRHGGKPKTTLLVHLKPVEDTPRTADGTTISKGDVANGGMITGTVETITPETAKRMLGLNTNNRNISRKQVELFARTMSQNAWRINGEAVKFSDGGRLLDGQHRLLACIESGVPFRTLVIRGLPEETQQTMDSGKTRTMANVLELQGRANTTHLAALARTIYVGEQLGVDAACTNSVTPTRNELLEFIDSTPELERTLRKAEQFYTKSNHLLSISMAGLLYWTFDRIDDAASMTFFDRLATGANLNEGDPILVLRNSLFDINRGHHSDGATRRRIAGMTIKAWNRWRGGASVKILRFTPSETFPDAI